FINLVSDSKLKVGHGLESCTSEVEVALPFMLDGKMVTLVDTPGFNDTVKTEAEILWLIADFLAVTYKQGRTLNGVIYLTRITDTRMGGIGRKNLRLFRKLCGDETLKSVVIITNMWGDIKPSIGAAREREMTNSNLFFKLAFEKGAHMMQHDNTVESAHRIICKIIGFSSAPLRIQQNMVDERKLLTKTGAGHGLKAEPELERQAEQHRAELADLRSSMQELLEAKDAKLQELTESLRDVQAELAKAQAEIQHLRENQGSVKAS
ncbi:uncharacterized protein PHACADRAFT_107075, partial [Phanerochaete carnosa HHB-10118-sp]